MLAVDPSLHNVAITQKHQVGDKMKIERLKVDHYTQPLGVHMENPTFSWVVSESTGKIQTAARVRIALNEKMENPIFDSGRRTGISSLGFTPQISLSPRTRYFWDVEVWADSGDHARSDAAWFETAKMDEPWQGEWIRAPFEEHPIFRKSFPVTKPVSAARLYLCGLGLYEANLNGEKVGDEYLAPFFTSYQHHIQYQTYDITDLLQAHNCLSVLLGRGWYHGRFGFGDKLDKIYGQHMQLIAEVQITYADGTHEVIGSDESWECSKSPVLESNIYDGEVWDARLAEQVAFAPSIVAQKPAGALRARLSLPVTVHECLKPMTLLHTPAEELVLDFGQIITGWVEFDTDCDVFLQYGELLQNACFYNENLRSAKAEYTYFSDGQRRHVRPHFTFYGFRYVKVSGLTAEQIEQANFTAYAIYSDLEQTGSVTTSNEKVNRLILNAYWSQKDNFLDVPTDCPQRDERMGWTGDAQMFASTASFVMDTAAFYRKYLYDMALEQQDNGGSVPFVVPDVLTARLFAEGKTIHDGLTGAAQGSCAWGDAATVIPWTLYQYFGDPTLLASNYENMCAWLDFIHREDLEKCGGSHLWSCGFHFADWLALDNPDPTSTIGSTEDSYVATAYYYWSAHLTAMAGEVLGKARAQSDADHARQIKAAFQRRYLTPDGYLTQTTQTAYVLALSFDLLPEQHREKAVCGLKEKLDQRDIHLDTGFVGTGLLCDALSEHGLSDYAHTLLLKEDYPSWLYEVNMGATTIWERWNSILPDGQISGTEMNSMNHYAYGAVVGWIYRHMAGLQVDAPGWKRARICPETDSRFDFVQAQFHAAAGLYESSWVREHGLIRYTVTVPFDAQAHFVLPHGQQVVSVDDEARTEVTDTLYAGTHTIVAKEL